MKVKMKMNMKIMKVKMGENENESENESENENRNTSPPHRCCRRLLLPSLLLEMTMSSSARQWQV